MNCVVFGLSFAFLAVSVAAPAQVSASESISFPALVAADPDPLAAFGAGQVEYSAVRREAFTRLTFGINLSSLGTGIMAATNVGPHVDARVFGNYFNFDHDVYKTGFRIHGNLELANAGAMADFYPFYRVPLRISPGFLFFNQDRARVDIRAQQGATITINDIDWNSDNADPLHGTGRLRLGGSGFAITTGLGRYVSRSSKRFTFPFEAGVAFIRTPTITFGLFGQICTVDQSQCQPAATFPTFADNLAQQLAAWNSDAAPFHIYPIVQGGVAYSFHIRGQR
jgi:hypothetical protein